MQVVILCGGQGTRIRDVADDIPKPMIPIGERPILWHIMKSYAHYGYRDFVLCLGYKSWVIKRFFLDYHLASSDLTLHLSHRDSLEVISPVLTEDWKVTLVETGQQAMTGCRIKRVARYITSDHFMVTYGDGVADVDIPRLVAYHHRHGKIGTMTAVFPPARFGEIELDGDRICEFNEKPPLTGGRINGGFFVFRRQFLDRLEDEPDLVLERQPLTQLAQEGELMAHKHDGFWQPMDSSRDYQYLNGLWNEGTAQWKCWDAPRRRKAA
jgi:glucose-1-phosphate cytidylyltransferase